MHTLAQTQLGSNSIHGVYSSPWTTLYRGKYEGRTLPELAFRDPDYLFWTVEANCFKTDPLKAEAELIYRRSRHIKLPDAVSGSLKVLYDIHPGSGKLCRVWVIQGDWRPEQFSDHWYLSDYFDLSLPRRLCPYDKAGSKILVKAIKEHVFKGARLTKDRCEEFFSDPRNFARP